MLDDINFISEFLVEDMQDKNKSLNGGITKKFTSLAINAIIFRWRFGDTHQNPIIETTENPYYHAFREKGTYLVSHQSCYHCSGQLVCSDGWCTKSVSIEIPGRDLTALAIGGICGFLIFKGTDCGKTKEECDRLIDYCQWIEKEKICVRKCKEGYRLKEISHIKRPKCLPKETTKKEQKLTIK